MNQPLKPGHKGLLTWTRGRVRLSCVCGWQSSRREDKDGEGTREVAAEYDAHLGLKERY